ncbi:MAG: ROK family protein [Bacteriovoracia bacterium]
MKNDQVAFGIDIGGTNTKIGLFDHLGTLKSFRIHPTSKTSDPSLFVEQLAQECDHMVSSEFGFHLGDKKIVGVGAGAPMANYFTGRVDNAPNLGWTNVPLQKLFEEKFQSRAVIENDANLAAVGEKKWGSGKDLNDFILITLGTGVGAGLILDGKLHRGHNALGGEGGHIIIPHEKKRLCSCGGLNHLESFLSAKGIKQTIHELIGEEWTIEKLGIEFRGGNLRAATIINTIAFELATGFVTMAVLLGPEAFIIGGGVSKLGDSFNQVVLNKFNELVHYSLKDKVKIVTASLSSDKGAIYGGAAHIIDEVFGK